MKKTGIVITALIVIGILVGGYFLLSQQQSEKEIKIGAILSLTGSIADQGKWVRNGLELSEEEINENKINGKAINLIIEDGRADKKPSLDAYHNIKLQYDVPIVITMGSSVAIALNPIVNEDNVIQMGVATASPDYTTPNDFNFRVFETATLEMEKLANEIKNNFGFDTVAVLWINNEYGKGVKNAFVNSFEEYGEIVYMDSFDLGERDFRTYLENLRAKNPDAIVLVTYTKEGANIMKQARKSGIDLQFFSSQAILAGAELFDIAGEHAEGLLIANPKFDFESEEPYISKFREAYISKFDEEPSIYGGRAYDALKILAKALENCGQDTVCIKDYLFTVKNYEGVSGLISFDENGDVIRPFELKVIKNKKIIPYR